MAYIEQFQSLIHEGRTCNTRETAGSGSQNIGSRKKKGKVTLGRVTSSFRINETKSPTMKSLRYSLGLRIKWPPPFTLSLMKEWKS